MSFQVVKIEVNRNPFIGLYLTASDDAVLCSHFVPDNLLRLINDVLKPSKILPVSIADSHLTGIYTAMNSTGVALPGFTDDKTLHFIKRELGVNVCKIDDRFSAVRSNVLVNDSLCMVNAHMARGEHKKLADCFDAEVIPLKFGKVSTIGAVNVVTNKGVLAYNDASENELQLLSKAFKFKAIPATCNFGTPATSFGVIANKNGALIGSNSTGFEAGLVYEALSGEQ